MLALRTRRDPKELQAALRNLTQMGLLRRCGPGKVVATDETRALLVHMKWSNPDRWPSAREVRKDFRTSLDPAEGPGQDSVPFVPEAHLASREELDAL